MIVLDNNFDNEKVSVRITRSGKHNWQEHEFDDVIRVEVITK
jgi:hypothetical protein